jgi:hypothetical protein
MGSVFMRRIWPALLPYATFGFLLLVSWQRWIEPYVDSGRELMVPWRVAHGETLYRQVHFHHGPLAPYLGAAVDRIAGPSLDARVVLAAFLALFHLETLRRLSLRFLTEWRADLVTSLAVATAFFLRPGGWLFPFSFDTAIAVAGLGGAALFATGDRPRDGAAAVCLAAALLSRLELGLVGILAIAWETRRSRRRWLMLLATPLAAAVVIYATLSLGMSLDRLVYDGWLALARPPAAFQSVYRAYAGLDRPGFRLVELALAAVLLVLVASLLSLGSAIARRVHNRGGRLAVEMLVAAILIASAVVSLLPSQTSALIPPLVRVVPPAILIAAAFRLAERLTGRPEKVMGLSDASLLIAAIFASRLLLAAGYVGPYDAFFLPLPLVIASGLALAAADRLAGSIGKALPRLTAVALVVFLASRLAAQVLHYRLQTWSLVSTPAGNLRLQEPVATTTGLAVRDLAARIPKGGTLVGFPEAGFFNYVLDRRNPIDREQFFPGHVETAAAEDRIIRQLQVTPPDAVLLCNVLAIGESQPAFGRDYLGRLGDFLRENFEPGAAYGPGAGPDARIGDPQFFVAIRVPRSRLSLPSR